MKLFLQDRFFPPPLLYKKSDYDGRLLIGDPIKDSKNASFLSLFKRLSIQVSLKDGELDNLPYDFHCATVQGHIEDRKCPFCDIYFASLKNVKEHRKVVHPKQRVKSNSKTTATRIIKRRDDEVLCVVKESQDVEWVENEDVIVESPDPSQESDKKDEDLPIINSIEGWLKCEWEDVD